VAGSGAGKIADGLVRDRDKALERARALAEEIAANLARANELDRDSDEALARAGSQAAELADALTSPTLRSMASRASRVLAQTRLRGVSESLDAVQMDVSGRDLSVLESLDAGQLGVLKGVIWTDETRWPPGLTEPIRARSHEIRPGVYQIHRAQGDPTPEIFEVEDPA
jgi:hypothetical protein